MGIKADGIEVSIESSASKAIAELDKLIAKLNQVSNSTRAISTSNNNKTLISSKNAMSGMGKKFTQEIEKAQKGTLALQKVISDFSNVGKGARFDGTYSQLEKEISKVTTRLDTLGAREEKMKALGRDNPSSTMWKDLQYEISKSLNTLIAYQEQLSGMSVSNKSAFSWQGVPYDNFEDFWEAKNRFVEASSKIEESIEAVQQKISESTNSNIPFSKDATEKAKSFEKSISKAIIPAASLGEKMKALSASADKTLVKIGAKRYSDEYANLQKEIDASKRKIETLNAQIEKGRATNNKFSNSVSLKKYQYEIDKTKDKILELENAQDKLQMSGKSTKWNAGQKYEAFMGAVTRVRGGIGKIDAVVSGTTKLFTKLSRKILSVILPLNAARKSMDRFSGSSGRVSKSMGMMLRAIKMMIVYKAFRATINGIKTGMENLAQYSAETNSSLSVLMNSMNQLKNATASAVAPILNAFAPAINSVIQICIKATNAVNQLFAALTGQNTWIKATALTEDYANKIKSATKEAEKHKRSIMSYDELNIASDNSNSGSSGTSPSDMFDTVQIESKYKELADKIKDIANKLFAPIKQAWDEMGKFVMDSWGFALERVWSLIKTIGADFIKVWQQQATVNIFKDILAIIGDIGLVVGHLAENFERAWSANDVGLHILENIRDVIGIIVSNVKHAADATVNWSKNLNFTPLLEAFERFTSSLKPAIDALSGALTDFYEKVLLPLGKWTIEKGLPQLLDVFTAFNEKVDWDSLRKRLSQFWEHLEPFAETVGEGLIVFIERCSDLLANFINSDKFDSFLTGFEKWMDNVKPNDVADAIENLVKALFALKGVLVALDSIIKASAVIKAVSNAGKFVGGISKISKSVAGLVFTMDGLKFVFSSLNPGMIGELGLTVERFLQGSFLDTSTWSGIPQKLNDLFNSIIDFVGTGIVNIFGAIGEILASTFNWDATLQLFESARVNFEKGGLYIVQGIIEGMLGAIGFIVEPIGDFFTGVWNALCDFFGIHSPATSMYPIGEYVMLGIVEGFRSKFNESIAAVKEWYEKIKGELSNSITSLVDNVATWFAEMPGKIYDSIMPFFEKAREWASTVKGIFGEKSKEIISSVVGFFKALPGNIYDAIKGFFQKIRDWVRESISVVGSTVPRIISSITGVFTSLPNQLYNIGKQAFQGFSNGMQSMFSSIWNTVSSFASRVVSTITSVLRIHSPSRVMFELGEFTIEGYENGLKNLFSDVYGTLSNFSERIKGEVFIDTSAMISDIEPASYSLNAGVVNQGTVATGMESVIGQAVTDGMMQVFMATSGDTGNQNSDRPIQIILDRRIVAEVTYRELEDMAMRGEIPAII